MPHPPFIILDETSELPLYRQIYDAIRRSILIGEFFPGKFLPPTRFLAKQLGISRMTVINAYDQLSAEGYLESKKGAGTFVAAHLPKEFLNAPHSEKQKLRAEIVQRKHKLSDYGKSVLNGSDEILRFHQATPIIPFQHGLAAINEFPFDVLMKLANKSYRTLTRENFGYGDPAGFYPLREAIAGHLRSVRAVNCSPEQVIITCGAQHAFDLIGRVLLEPKSEVLIENPCYLGAKQALQIFGEKLIPVPVDKSGMNLITEIENNKARLIYVTPSHQFPLGFTMTLKRRLELLEWANKQAAWIIEDDYDSEFRYEGRPLPSLQGLDSNGRVLYVGTFSKTIFPALKLGCLVVPTDLIEMFTAVRSLSGAQSPIVEQATLAEFITEGHFGRHLRRMRNLYEARQQILITEIEKQLRGKLEVKSSVSGMHIIGWLPAGLDDMQVASEAIAKGVKASAVSTHFSTKPDRGGLILGYTAFDEGEIRQGVRKLSSALRVFE